MVHKVYKRDARPLARVVRGSQTSWDPVVAAVYSQDVRSDVVWSPCHRFIAVAKFEVVEVRDAVTLNLLGNFESHCFASALSFSPDGRFLTQFYYGTMVTWDLQTGISVITDSPNLPRIGGSSFSPAYSMNGKMLVGGFFDMHSKDPFITTHNFSTTCTYSYRVSEGYLVSPLWTHGEFLQFATIKSGYITIWQADFAFTHPPEVVESLPTPDELINEEASAEYLFLPTTSRFAIYLQHTLLVWDARDSKRLLKVSDSLPSWMSFSSDGHFFVCLLRHESDTGIHIWKESPGGYILHRKLTLDHPSGNPQLYLSPNGESIILTDNSIIHLLHTEDLFLSDHPTLAVGQPGFILNLSPNYTLAAFTRYGGNVVTILDLQSGDQRLEINTGMELGCLGVTGSTLVAADHEKIVTWKLATRNARANIHDSVRITKFDPPPGPRWEMPFRLSSVSSDLSRIITLESRLLEIHDVSTGRRLAGPMSAGGVLKPLSTPRA